MNSADLQSLRFMRNKIVFKIFSATAKEMTREISKFFGINPLEQVISARRDKCLKWYTAHRTIYAKWYIQSTPIKFIWRKTWKTLDELYLMCLCFFVSLLLCFCSFIHCNYFNVFLATTVWWNKVVYFKKWRTKKACTELANWSIEEEQMRASRRCECDADSKQSVSAADACQWITSIIRHDVTSLSTSSINASATSVPTSLCCLGAFLTATQQVSNWLHENTELYGLYVHARLEVRTLSSTVRIIVPTF